MLDRRRRERACCLRAVVQRGCRSPVGDMHEADTSIGLIFVLRVRELDQLAHQAALLKRWAEGGELYWVLRSRTADAAIFHCSSVTQNMRVERDAHRRAYFVVDHALRGTLVGINGKLMC